MAEAESTCWTAIEAAAAGAAESREAFARRYGPVVRASLASRWRASACLQDLDDAVQEVARFATTVNESTENIGARRLHTIMEKLLDEISFEGPDLKEKRQIVDAAYVRKMLADIVKNEDLSRYIL